MTKLRRNINLLEVMLTGVGTILGAGIYVIIGKVAGIAGNAMWISFGLAAVIAALTGLSYAELSSIIPKAGAEYEYAKKAFGNRIAFVIGWLLLIAGIVSASAVSLGFAGYFGKLLGMPTLPVAVGMLIALSVPLFYGVKESVRAGVIMTLVEAFGLFVIIMLGIPYLGNVNYLEIPDLSALMQGAALIFFAYIGFGEIVRLSEETKNAEKAIPKAVILSIAITTILYILVAISAVGIMDWHELAVSASPLADVASVALGDNAFLLLSLIALFSTANTVLFVMLSTSRLLYGMFEKIDSPLSFVHPKTKTPWFSIGCVMLASILFLFMGGIEKIASMTNFMILINYFFVNLIVIRLRYTFSEKMRPFRIPFNIGKFPLLAFLGMITTLIMLASIHIEIIFWGTVFVLIGIIIYELLRRSGVDI
ncbi:MAG: amino acid permease [Candidatus Micrarchaeota archaeon]|nr:amino acid permease [Candidatus Micrarchaeota archaeon]